MLCAILPLPVLAESALSYAVTIEPGLTPRMSPSEVAGLVAGRERTVIRLECFDGAVLRAAFSDASKQNRSPMWRVHLSSGDLYVVDDSNGEMIAHGRRGGGRDAAPKRERLEGGR